MAAMRRSVVRLPDGAILLRLSPNQRAIVRALVDDLRTIVGEESPTPGMSDADAPGDGDVPDAANAEDDRSTSPADPVLARLYPDARPDDPAWSGRFRDLVRGELDEGRRRNIHVVEETLEARSLDDDQAESWLHVLNDLRLVLGTRLGVTEEDEDAPFDPEDEDAAVKVVYAYAGLLESQFVDVLADRLPDAGADAPSPASDEGHGPGDG